MTDLGTLGGTVTGAEAINAAGDVVGSSKTADGSVHAFLYRNGVLMDLGVPFGSSSTAVAINASGQIVVQSSNDTQKSFLYNNGQYTDLGGLGGNVTVASAINDAGQITGYASTVTESHAFLYSGDVLQDLGTLGAMLVRPSDINNAGQIVGSLGVINPNTGMGEFHGFLYENGMVRDFGANSGPGKINDLGHFIGSAAGFGPILNRNGEVIPLADGRPFALNNNDVIVGENDFGMGASRAALFEGGEVIDLNTLIAPRPGYRLQQALGINDLGQIVGNAFTSSGETRAFLLTPIPEPAGLAIVLLGAAVLLCRPGGGMTGKSVRRIGAAPPV